MSDKINSKFVTVVVVTDPDSKLPVEVEIRKLETGAMVGIDGSWLEQDVGPTFCPYDKNVELNFSEDSDDEQAQAVGP